MAVKERVRDRAQDVRVRAQGVRDRAEHVQTRVERLLQIDWIAHIQRAVQRYNGRFGYQFGAGVAYFSVLAIIPVFMVAFSILGFFLVELRPDLISKVADLATAQFRGVDPDTIATIEAGIVSLLNNYTSIGVIGLIAGLYSAATWMGHLRNAIDAQWRADFDAEREVILYPLKVAINLVRMAGLLVAVAITFGLATISTNFAQQIAVWLGFGDSWFTSALLRVLAPALSLVAGWVTFCYIYIVVPRQRESWRHIWTGAIFGAIGLFILQYATALIINLLSGNRAAAVFGPVIVVMLFFNLFAQLILIIAAWIATWDEPAFLNLDESRVRFALTPAQPVETGPPTVTEEVAVNSVRLGLGAGWVTGTATGLGLGALLTWLAATVFRLISGRRPSR
ncbi:MAG TPA: YhjD/YihY/BrkB family envelope integrity protein [Microlunatus sp.]